jgi:hypothetical protein
MMKLEVMLIVILIERKIVIYGLELVVVLNLTLTAMLGAVVKLLVFIGQIC